MRYTAKSLAFLWLVSLTLFALSGSGVVAGPWLLLLLAVAFAVPVLILRNPHGDRAAHRPERVEE
jgi:uncharacterized protein (DUF58 family)